MPFKTYDDSEDNLWPWPDHSAKIFQGGSLWGIHGLDMLEAWELYAEGYKRAAEQLWKDPESYCNTYLLFPMAFLYRHYVELRIKHMLFVSLEYPDLPPMPTHWKLNHDLKSTWDLLQARLLAMPIELPEKELRNVGRLISELHKKDPGSFVFRYPTTRTGDNHLSDPNLDLNSVDISGYFESMRQLSEFLDVLGGCLHEVIRQRDA
jgi:hypothetical protein